MKKNSKNNLNEKAEKKKSIEFVEITNNIKHFPIPKNNNQNDIIKQQIKDKENSSIIKQGKKIDFKEMNTSPLLKAVNIR